MFSILRGVYINSTLFLIINVSAKTFMAIYGHRLVGERERADFSTCDGYAVHTVILCVL